MRPILRTLALLCALPSVCAQLAPAATVYVDNVGGDDLHDGSQPTNLGGSGPVRTLRKALRICHAGDRILLADTGQPYRESISLSTADHCGTALSPFIIDGQGAILEGVEPVPPEAWVHERGPVFRFHPPRSTYQQLFLDGEPAKQRKLAAGETRLPQPEPLEWYRRGADLFFCVERDKLPRNYDLAYCERQTGITVYHVHDVLITDLIVQGFRLDGINVNDGVTACQIQGVISRGNGRSGVTVAGSSRARIADCVIGDNGHQQLLVEGPSSTVVEGSQLIANTAPAVNNRGAKLVVREGAPANDRDGR